MSAGIDYSHGMSNFDPTTGIHFGVIPMNEVVQTWADESDSEFIARCPDCGNKTVEKGTDGSVEDYVEHWCSHCNKEVDHDDAYGDEPDSIKINNGEYQAFQDSHGDIMILKSPYYSKSKFCSPCAPGAGYLLNPDDDGVKTYCFGHDWFDEGKAPYRVFNVSDDTEIVKEAIL